jgi:hypothetical protein
MGRPVVGALQQADYRALPLLGEISFDVACSSDHAFTVWTSGIGTWWPPDHTVTGQAEEVVLQSGVGGRIFECTSDGVEPDWGTVTVWEPPTRLAYHPADVDTICNVSGRISRDALSETRDDEGRWIGGGVTQWVEELTFAVREHSAAAFIYLVPPGDSISETTLHLWAHEVVPAVREAVARG